jgi:hypothetical protein
MTKDFVVPQMALEDISAIEGWRRLWLWLKADKGGYAGYIGMKIVLAIGAAILVFIVDLIAMLVLLIPFGGFGVAAVLGGKAAGWTWNFYTIALAVVLGCIALAILIFVLALISVPVIVFFPAYSIYFFAQRYPPLASLLWPQSPAPAATGQVSSNKNRLRARTGSQPILKTCRRLRANKRATANYAFLAVLRRPRRRA